MIGNNNSKLNWIKQVKENKDNYFMTFMVRSLSNKLRGKNIFCDHMTAIRNISNIDTLHGNLFVGINQVGFISKWDRSLINARGKLAIFGNVYLGRGCRLDINKLATCTLESCTITGVTNIIISHELTIKKNSKISWGCEFLDDDWHTLQFPDKTEKSNAIYIDEHVWIGSHVKILKGVSIGKNTIIASNSVVTKSFPGNVLIAGIPAKIIKHNVTWN